MCGRVTSTTSPERLAELLDAIVEPDLPAFGPRYNVAPDAPLFVVTQDGSGRRTLGVLRWGFRSPVGAIINARSESVGEKPTFRSVLQNRCLVPIDGYYEWEAVPGPRGGRGRRLPHYMTAVPRERLDRGGLLLVAGLWRVDGGQREGVLLTQNASPEVAHVHDRMPLVLDRSGAESWLSGTPAAEVVGDALRHAATPVQEHRVDVRVNDARYVGADAIEPIPAETLF